MILRLRLIFYTDDERGDRMPAYVNGNGHKGSNCVIRGWQLEQQCEELPGVVAGRISCRGLLVNNSGKVKRLKRGRGTTYAGSK